MVLKTIICWCSELWIVLSLDTLWIQRKFRLSHIRLHFSIISLWQWLWNQQLSKKGNHFTPWYMLFLLSCVLVTLRLTRQITDSMSTQKTINKTSHLCMLYQTAVWHRWWKRKRNLSSDLKLSSFFSLQRQRQSKKSAFMTPFASGSCLTGNRKISGKMIRSSQSMWVKIDARINVSLSHTEVYNDNDPCSLKNSLLGNRHGDIPKILRFIGGWLLTQGQMFFPLSIFL